MFIKRRIDRDSSVLNNVGECVLKVKVATNAYKYIYRFVLWSVSIYVNIHPISTIILWWQIKKEKPLAGGRLILVPPPHPTHIIIRTCRNRICIHFIAIYCFMHFQIYKCLINLNSSLFSLIYNCTRTKTWWLKSSKDYLYSKYRLHSVQFTI